MIQKLILTSVALAVLTTGLYAGPIALANPNFDADATNTFLLGTLSGWSTNSQEYGVWNTTSSMGVTQALAPMSVTNVLYLGAIPDGQGGRLDGAVMQTTPVSVTTGGTYTFSIYAASRKDTIQPVAFSLELFAGAGNAFAVQNFTASSLSSSSWTLYTVTGVAPGNAAGNIGVRVALNSTGLILPGSTNPDLNKFQVLFENAGLTGPDAVAEPACSRPAPAPPPEVRAAPRARP